MNLRSSAPNTPNKPRGVNVTPNTTPTRKLPHCRKCQRPRAGHPRSGCPYVEENNPAPTREATAEPDNHIAHALNSLHITPENDHNNTAANKENTSVRTRPNPSTAQPAQPRANATRLSLSTTAGEVFQRLRAGENEPPPYYDLSLSRRQSRIARIEEWQHSVAVAMESTESDTDGSGNCSGPLNVVDNASEGPSSNRSNSRRGLGLRNPNGGNGALLSLSSRSRASNSNSNGGARRPLVRSMSMEEREAFVKSLNEASDATVYVLPKVDIHDVNATAVKLGFRTRIVMNERDEDDLQALLVLARDEERFEWLSEKIEKEDKALRKGQQSTRTFGLVAGGAVIGAVGAWARVGVLVMLGYFDVDISIPYRTETSSYLSHE
ncbi:hypothetical protein F5887DRAFT_1075608 [Amanita rubescens]|nr:hypothetical protein F5887DRAFT_1075608 [Amanita rubescens]